MDTFDLLPKEALELDDFYFDFFADFLCFVRRGARAAFVLLPFPNLGWCALLRGCHAVSGVGDVAEIFLQPGDDRWEAGDGEDSLLSQQCVPYCVDVGYWW